MARIVFRRGVGVVVEVILSVVFHKDRVAIKRNMSHIFQFVWRDSEERPPARPLPLRTQSIAHKLPPKRASLLVSNATLLNYNIPINKRKVFQFLGDILLVLSHRLSSLFRGGGDGYII